jgi:predicted HAD superfamily hydrolase
MSKTSEEFFFSFGAEILGPVFSIFADWVLDIAKKRKIQTILPFMREGELITKIIKNADTNKDFFCFPIFVSRLTAFIASIYDDNFTERVNSALIRGNRKLSGFFEELGIEIKETVFIKNSDTLVNEIQSGVLEEFLHLDDVKSTILLHSSRQRELLKNYLTKFTKGQTGLTVDIGIK